MVIGFWRWLIHGSGGKRGLFKFFDIWLVFHLAIGAIFSLVVPAPAKDVATSFLLPLAGILVGLSFSWSGNAQALLGTDEIEALSKHHPGGLEEYAYTFQASILLILCTLGLWGFAALGIVEAHIAAPAPWPLGHQGWLYQLYEVLIYSFASLTVRECWHIVLFAQTLLVTRSKIKNRMKSK